MAYRPKSIAELPPHMRRMVEGGDPYNTAGPPQPKVTTLPDRRGANKYGAKKQRVDGVVFDSKLEAARYAVLKLLQAAGEVLYFSRQGQFVLEGGVVLKYDFAVMWRDHGHIHEDVKGHLLQVTRNKVKQLKARFPHVRLVYVRTEGWTPLQTETPEMTP